MLLLAHPVLCLIVHRHVCISTDHVGLWAPACKSSFFGHMRDAGASPGHAASDAVSYCFNFNSYLRPYGAMRARCPLQHKGRAGRVGPGKFWARPSQKGLFIFGSCY